MKQDSVYLWKIGRFLSLYITVAAKRGRARANLSVGTVVLHGDAARRFLSQTTLLSDPH